MSLWKRGVIRDVIAQSSVGEYHALSKYLRDRFANRVVLTFAEIDDILGFALSDPALLQAESWDGRVVTINFIARTVVFERLETRGA